jgi:histidinol phosphatase-like enzyme
LANLSERGALLLDRDGVINLAAGNYKHGYGFHPLHA